jgi:hypothetical protein
MQEASRLYSFAAVGVHLCNDEHPATAYAVSPSFGWTGSFFSGKSSLHFQADRFDFGIELNRLFTHLPTPA